MTEEKINEEKINKDFTGENPTTPSHSIVPAKVLLPTNLPIVPLYSRPLFPKMMGPVIVENEAIIKAILAASDKNNMGYLGLLMVHHDDDKTLEPHEELSEEDFFHIGVAAQVMQIAPHHEGEPLQLLVHVLERFEVLEFISREPIFRAQVQYWSSPEYQNNEELKAYSVAIVDAIRELVKLNPLFKEGLSFLLERINVNDPGALSDLSSTMTTASGNE